MTGKPVPTEAGPEMDRAVAERVMGLAGPDYRRLSDIGVIWYHILDGHAIRGAPYQYDIQDGGRWDHQWANFNPSTNIAHAWEVIGKLRQRGYVTLTDCGEHWDVAFYAGSCATPIGCRDASAPLAICKAALQATAQDNK